MLAQSLRNSGYIPEITLAALVTEEVSKDAREKLGRVFDSLIDVPTIRGISSNNLQMIGRPDLATTLTKLNLWSLTQFERVVFLDADTLALNDIGHLFTLPKDITFAASPELGFPDCFNSGFMVLTPSANTFNELKTLARQIESFDGGDQGILNVYFGDGTLGHPMQSLLPDTAATVAPRPWHRLSFTYNMEMHKVYRFYIPAVLRYRSQHKVLHFIGKDKPWHFPDGKVERPEDAPAYYQFYCEMIEEWWKIRRQLDWV